MDWKKRYDRNFKVGDKIKCIRPTKIRIHSGPGWIEGNIYKIQKINKSTIHNIPIIFVEEQFGGIYIDWLERV